MFEKKMFASKLCMRDTKFEDKRRGEGVVVFSSVLVWKQERRKSGVCGVKS